MLFHLTPSCIPRTPSIPQLAARFCAQQCVNVAASHFNSLHSIRRPASPRAPYAVQKRPPRGALTAVAVCFAVHPFFLINSLPPLAGSPTGLLFKSQTVRTDHPNGLRRPQPLLRHRRNHSNRDRPSIEQQPAARGGRRCRCTLRRRGLLPRTRRREQPRIGVRPALHFK